MARNLNDISIVLTGTIIPNAPYTVHSDPEIRRCEYLTAIQFYRQFAPVYFLENSRYELLKDSDFVSLENVKLCQFPLSSAPERGKGYQEFEMIDNWLANKTSLPARWIKVTGRYIYSNFHRIFDECQREVTVPMIIDRCARSKFARSYLFYTRTEFYRRHISGLYEECQDDSGEWIERVLYRHLAKVPPHQVRLFSTEPRLRGISGSTGEGVETHLIRYVLKRAFRKFNYAVDNQQLWYTR